MASVVLLVSQWSRIKPWLALKVSYVVSEHLPKLLGGSPCHLGHVDITLGSTCGVEIHDLVIGNLPGFKSDYLFKLGQVGIDVDIRGAIVSAFRKNDPVDIDITRVLVQTVHVIYERSLCSSNVEALLDFIAGSDSESEESEDEVEHASRGPPRRSRGPGIRVNVRKTDIEDIQLEAALTIGKKYGLDGVVVQVAPLHYNDFSEEVGKAQVQIIVQLLVQSILRSVRVTCANMEKTGQVVSEKLSEVKEEATSKTREVTSAAQDGKKLVFQSQRLAEGSNLLGSDRERREAMQAAVKVGRELQHAWTAGSTTALSSMSRVSSMLKR